MQEFPTPENTPDAYVYTFQTPLSFPIFLLQLVILFCVIVLGILFSLAAMLVKQTQTITPENYVPFLILCSILFPILAKAIDALLPLRTINSKVADKKIIAHRYYSRRRIMPTYYSTYQIILDDRSKYQVHFDEFAAVEIADTVSLTSTPLFRSIRSLSVEKKRVLSNQLLYILDTKRMQKENELQSFDNKLFLLVMSIIGIGIIALSISLRFALTSHYTPTR